MLTMLSGRSHEVFSGLTILDVHASKEGIVPLKSQTRVVRTKVTFKKLAPAEITSYIATGEPMDKSGSYGAQGIGAYIIKKIEGSYTNVVGLPLTELCEMLGLDNLYRE
jgi:septum formation protein